MDVFGRLLIKVARFLKFGCSLLFASIYYAVYQTFFTTPDFILATNRHKWHKEENKRQAANITNNEDNYAQVSILFFVIFVSVCGDPERFLMADEIMRLCDTIRETSFALHHFLQSGHLEKVYENGLAHRLRKRSVVVETQFAIPVFDEDTTPLGDFYADLFVNGVLIVELKACKSLTDAHIAQLLGYMRASRVEHGLLINFGAPALQIKKFILTANRK